MTNKRVDYNSLRITMEMFRNLCFNVHGLIDIVDDRNYKAIMQMIDDAEKYRWHDLRKNPEDLPDKNYATVEVWLKGRVVDIAVYTELAGFRPWYSAVLCDAPQEWDETGCVFAWREIEPFEEDANG